jgi:3-isopropylmalate/(R)-2-methylmalate dehydratase small subunit
MARRAWKFGSNVDTDTIISGNYLTITDPVELARHCMEGVDKEFTSKIKKKDIIVAGENFGCGSSREQAPICLQVAGISCVIAKTFARIFFRNSINIGFSIIECEEASDDIQEGNLIEIDYKTGLIKNLTNQKMYQFNPFPTFIEDIISVGGLIPYTRKRILEQSKKNAFRH